MQKIAIKVEMSCHKSRSKAMETAAAARGVISVAVEGEDLMLVTGNGVDPVRLTNDLRKKKKFRDARLLTVQDLDIIMDDATNPNNGDGDGDGDGEDEANPPQEIEDQPLPLPLPSGCCTCNCSHFPPPCPPPTYGQVVYEYDPHPTPCSIM